jgi:putative ABC transport system permease protein
MDTVALIRRSLRGLLRVPAFTSVCLLTLAVGIGAATAIFSIVDGVLLTPLPYPEPERLVGLWHSAPAFGFDKLSQSPGTYMLYRQRSRSFEDIALYRSTQVNATGDGAPERLPAGLITPSLFPVLRVKPSLGRAFVAEEGRPEAAPVVLLSDQLWRRRFAADPRALGRPIRIDGVPCEIVGVMPAGFEFPRAETELWLPLKIDPAQAQFGAFGPSGVARLRPETTPAAAQTELDQLLAGLSSSGDEAARGLIRSGFHARVFPLREDVVGDIGRTLWILLGAVGFILLIACANVSNLLIVRGEERRRETAIHTALGVSPRQLIGSVLLESLLLATAAGVLGLLLAAAGLRLLLKLAPPGLPRLEEIGIDGRVLLFAAAVAVLSSLLAGSFPALRSLLKGDLALELKAGGTRTTSGHAQQRMRRFLVGLQVGLALVLLTGSGLMLRSFLRLSQLDPGFATKDVLTFQLSLPEQDFPDDVAAAGFLDRVVERMRGLPGVRSAGVASTLPLSGSAQSSGHVIQDRPLPTGAPPPGLWFGYAGEGYFEALGIPLLAGRTLTRADQETRARVAVVNQAVARHFWPRGDALGKRLRPAAEEESGSEPWYTIVGIVGDVRNRDLAMAPDEMVYYPLLGQGDDAWTVRQANVVMRTRVAPESLASEVRSAVGSVNPNVPVSAVQSMEQILRRSQARMIYSVLMFVLATAVAMVLAAVGIYSFVSYVVSQRTAEFGVRMALGARARDLRWLILRESLAIALAGGLVGLLGALALTRWLGSLLFEISPLDPLTFILMPLLLLALVLLSSALPAERAARVDPVKALQFS